MRLTIEVGPLSHEATDDDLVELDLSRIARLEPSVARRVRKLLGAVLEELDKVTT